MLQPRSRSAGAISSRSRISVNEAKQCDIYALGTKLSKRTCLLQLDEFEARTPLSFLKVVLDKDNQGYEVRTGSSKKAQTHTEIGEDLRVVITSQWKPAKLEKAYRYAGATEEDLQAAAAPARAPTWRAPAPSATEPEVSIIISWGVPVLPKEFQASAFEWPVW